MLVVDIIYSASWTDLKNIVQWLRGRDESLWAEQAKVLSDTIAIFEELSNPIADPIAGMDGSPEAAGIASAMPCLQGMLAAMHGRRRQDALDYGNEALKLLPYG
jgi:hypothetical protein